MGAIYKGTKNLSIVLIIAGLVFIFLAAGISFSYELEKHVQKFTLSNGLTVLLFERHTSPTVSLYIRHKVGAVDEANGKTGTAHFLEHMIFKGTKTIGTTDYNREEKILRDVSRVGNALDREKKKGKTANKKLLSQLTKQIAELQKQNKRLTVSNEIDRIYTENGAVDLNASTGQDVTTYQVSLPANKIELWARIEADRMANPVFREFYSERDVIMEERRQSVESDPDGKLVEQFLAAAFHAHPYGRPILGWPSDMSSLDPGYIKDFFSLYYAPNNTVIAIVGDIDPTVTMKTVKKYFGGIKGGTDLLKSVPLQSFHITEEPPQRGERRAEVLFDANPQLIIGYHKPTIPSFDDYVFDIIESILGQGRTSRFYKILVEEKGIAESVQVTNSFPGVRYPNLFAVFATPRHPHTAAELEAEIYLEIEKLKKEGVSTKELNMAKNRLRADFIRGLASNSGLAGKLSYYEALAGGYGYLINQIDVIEKITSLDIIKVAIQYLTKENRTVAIIVKNENIRPSQEQKVTGPPEQPH
jgi:predicted Zn-dependent peptidase